MSRTFQLVGSSTLSIIATSTPGVMLSRGGAGPISLPMGVKEGVLVAETWNVNIKGTGHDNVASQVQTLFKLEKEAKQYKSNIWRTSPVYLQEQTTNETNARYAAVYEIRDIKIPDLFDLPMEANNELEGVELTIIREHPWRSSAPGTLGSAQTLAATDGPSSPTMVHLANFRDDGDLTHVWHYDDSAATFSSNLLSASSGTALFPSSPAAADYLVFGSTDIMPKHICVGITQAADVSWTVNIQYYNGSWQTMTLGTHYTIFAATGGEVTTSDDIFSQTGLWSINIFPPSDATTLSLNSQTVYAIRVYLSAVSSTTTLPQKDGSTIYAQRTNWFEVPAAVIGGDSPPTVDMRFWASSGGAEGESIANTSRILLGAKSHGIDDSSTQFCFSLNAGNQDNPGAWAVSAGTDGSLDADVQAPGGTRATCDFSSDTTAQVRLTLTGTSVMDNWKGEYLPLVRCQQIGGSEGDCAISVRTHFGGSAASDPYSDTPTVYLRGADAGPELVAFPLLSIPPGRAYNADSLASEDLIFDIYAQRDTGSSTLRIYDLLLLPWDEGSVAADDAALDVTNGNGALRGGTLLDIDAGLIADRTQKFSVDSSGNIKPVGIWARANRPVPFENLATKHRIYTVFLGYPSTWGSDPLVAGLGMHMATEVYAHTRYVLLRGSG